MERYLTPFGLAKLMSLMVSSSNKSVGRWGCPHRIGSIITSWTLCAWFRVAASGSAHMLGQSSSLLEIFHKIILQSSSR